MKVSMYDPALGSNYIENKKEFYCFQMIDYNFIYLKVEVFSIISFFL